MSKQIDLTKPISLDDYEYLEARPWLYRGRSIDDLEFESEEDEELETDETDDETEDDDLDESEGESEDEEDSDEDEDEDEDEIVEEEDEDVDLSQMTISQLRDLAEERGLEVPKKSKHADLVDLLS